MTQKTSEQAVFNALPGTIPQIMKKSGVSRASVFSWVARLMKAGKIHIKRWMRTTGQTRPYYVAGEGKSSPRPAAQTPSQYSRRYYAKVRRAEEIELRAIRKAARQNAKAMAKKPQTWLSALGALC